MCTCNMIGSPYVFFQVNTLLCSWTVLSSHKPKSCSQHSFHLLPINIQQLRLTSYQRTFHPQFRVHPMQEVHDRLSLERSLLRLPLTLKENALQSELCETLWADESRDLK